MPACPEEWFWKPQERHFTGRRRYRVQKWTHALILQVEIGGHDERMFSGEIKQIEPYWRDAWPTDIMREYVE